MAIADSPPTVRRIFGESLPLKAGSARVVSGICEKVILAAIVFGPFLATEAIAAEHRLAGRWGNSSDAVGVVQSCQSVFVFGKNGVLWADSGHLM